MENYVCNICNYQTFRRANFDRHNLSKKHKKMSKFSPNLAQMSKNLAVFSPKTSNFLCKYCCKEFIHQSSLSKHIKYHCTQNKDEDLKELVRLMNLQIQQKDKELKFQKEQNERQQKQIDKLMDKLDVTNITHNTTNIHNNIQLLSYKDTDISHLTESDYIDSLRKVTYCVKDLIEKIHFNPNKPENMNIYISNMKDKYIMVYEDGNWNLKHKSIELNELYDKKEILLEDWLNTYGTAQLQNKYQKYLNNKENNITMNLIHEKIKLMMYNKK